MNKTKLYLIIGLFIIAAIIAFAIYKGVSKSTVTTTTTGGTTTTQSTNGIGGVLTPILSIFGF